MSRLTTLYALDEALSNELLALEERSEGRATHPHLAIPEQPAPPKGMKPLIVHQRRPQLVYDDPLIIRNAFSRDLFWRSYLAYIRPTPTSAALAATRLQGWALYHLARKRELAGQALPLKSPATHVPAYALAPLPGRATNQRCILPDATRDDATSAGDWWARYGDTFSLQMTSDEWSALIAEFGAPEFTDVGSILEFDQLLGLQNYYGMSDLDVLQSLDAAWAESVFASAASRTLSDAGIEGAASGVIGTFDIVDPYTLDFLRNQSAYTIKGIDATTRAFISETLWTFLGGASDVFAPQNVDSVARILQQVSAQWDTDLANMSRARAFLISVTETARAESFGSFAAMWQTGVLYKYWMITSGACLICMGNAEAGNIGILESFPGGFQAPPQHPKCRCSLSAFVPEQFNPNEWVPRDMGAFDDMLFSNEGAQWPNVDLSGLQAELQSALDTSEIDLNLSDLGDLGRAETAEQTRKRSHKGKATRLPLNMDAVRRQADLGRAFMDAADAAMVAWTRAANVRVPTHLDEWKILAQELKSPTERHAAADARYRETLRAGLADAAKRMSAKE